MKKICRIILLCLWFVLAGSVAVNAQEGGEQPPARDPVFEQQIYERLAQINPDAVPIFQEATRAIDAGEMSTAKQGYEQVLALAPGFSDALRRLSYAEVALEDIESALQHAEQAYANDPSSPYNQISLAYVLLATEDSVHFTEALSHAQEAAAALPDDLAAQYTLLQAGIINQDMEAARQATNSIVRIAPDDPMGHYFAGLLAADEGKWEQAESELLLSQELGMPAEEVQEILAEGIRSQARFQRWLRRGEYALLIWLVSPLALFLGGTLLSKLTLKAAYRSHSTAQFEISRGEHLLRTLYRVVIAVTALYFYISIPVLILLVIAGAGGIFYLFYIVGRIPVQLAATIAVATFYTLYAIIRSLFTRLKDVEPGRPVSRDEAPFLWSLAEEVAARVGTRPVDAIYITPAPEIAVMERGRLWQKMRGSSQRCLILGLGALPGLTQDQLRAVLAHEYGHFSNRDTAGGNLARQVHASVNQLALGLARSGQARWYNPAWLFINGFIRIFLRITLGASRLQEILADRYAATAYGVQNFIAGLRHLIHQDLLFNLQVQHEVHTAQQQARALQNLYTLPDLQAAKQLEQLEAAEAKIMSRPTSPYDSHPAPSERIALLQPLETDDDPVENPEPAWELLASSQALQTEMTALIQANVRRQRAARPHRPASQPTPAPESHIDE